MTLAETKESSSYETSVYTFVKLKNWEKNLTLLYKYCKRLLES